MTIGSRATNAAQIISSTRLQNFTKCERCCYKSKHRRMRGSPYRRNPHGTYIQDLEALVMHLRQLSRTLRNSLHGPPQDDGGTR